MTERWTQERRVERTRELLLDGAEAVFAHKGFVGAALEDIADVAGYTRGAIYAHFGTKESLFLAVTSRYRNRMIDQFTDMLTSLSVLDELDMAQLAQRWRGPETDISTTVNLAALGQEFTLFLLRNPDALAEVTRQREETIAELARVITESVEKLGGALAMPAETSARLVDAIADGVVLGSHLYGVDLYQPFLQLFVAGIIRPIA